MRNGCVVVLSLALILSGCFGLGDDDHDQDHNGGHDPDNGHEEDHGGNVTNTPPSASLEASAEAGEAPFLVTFQLNGADPDGGNVTWTLELGDGNETAGDVLPTEYNHTYEVAGIYNVTFTVNDGINATAATLTINVTAGVSFEQFVLSGTANLPCPQCTAAGANTGAGFRGGQSGVDSVFGEIPGEAAGQPFVMTSSGGRPGISFRADCSGGAAIEAHSASGDIEGTVPAGARCALMWEQEVPQSTLTLTIG